MTVAVVGLGSIGGIAAGSLIAAGAQEVVACARRPLARLTLERPEGNVEVPLRTLTDPGSATIVDWVFLCTKTYQTGATAPWLARLCGPGTRVAVLQNGIERVARVAPLAGLATVVPTLVYYNGERIADGHVRVRHGHDADVVVADDADGRAFAQLFAGAALKVGFEADFTTRAWRKLLLNVTANPITALTLQRQAVLRRDDARALCAAILDEAIAVARAEGARFGDEVKPEVLAAIVSYPPEAGTSMYFDRVAGRPLEVEDLTGPIVAAGRAHGIPTPVNATLLTLLRAISEAPAR